MLGWEDYRESWRLESPLARDLLLKRALGFAPASETRLASLLRPDVLAAKRVLPSGGRGRG
jgi:hypothetical protein